MWSPWSGVRREAPGNPLHGQGRKSPTGAKMKSDVKLETFEDFREGENLKSRQLLVSFILSVLARGESKPCRSSTLSRDLFTLTD